MIIGHEALSAVFTGLKAMWAEAVQTTNTEAIERTMADVPSTAAGENYPVAMLLGDLEEVIDEVTITQIGAWVQNVPNRTFARIFEVRRNDIADDSIGIYRPSVRQLARRAVLYPLRLAAATLLAGFTTEWVDGQNVFDDAHPWPGGAGDTWDNLHEMALTADNFDTAYQAMETMVGPDGNSLGLTPDLLVCGPSNRSAAEGILEVQYLTDGGSNRRYKKCDLLVVSEFGSSAAWFLMDTDPVKPMVLQNREGPEFSAREDPDDRDAFYREVYGYKGRRRCAVAILAPWCIQASTGG
jgi:phage major head subunit gpT-like protein